MITADYLDLLSEKDSFNRRDLLTAMKNCGMNVGDALFKMRLQELLNDGSIARVGRNAYCVTPEGMTNYSCVYSELSEEAADIIQSAFPHLDFSIFELVQLNEFVNHQIANNIVFVSVEGNLGQFVFDTLAQSFPGKVLVYPEKDVFHQYWSENMLVIERLITEAPKDSECKWHVRIEKLLVDIMSDPLLRSSFSVSEVPGIYEQAFQRYLVDESCLFRYAARRNMKNKILTFIRENTNVHLRTVH